MNDLRDIWIGMFEFLTRAVFSDGGDGDGIVFCKHGNAKELADLFQEYLAAEGITDLHRMDSDDHVLFTDMSNENIIFTNDMTYDVPIWYTVRITF